MVINIKNFKSALSDRFIELMESERGVQTKLAKAIGKNTSYFSEIKRGNPVNALHLKAVGVVFGAQEVMRLLGINIFNGSQTRDDPESQQDSMPIVDHRVIPQNQREGIISNFKDKEMARKMILDLIEIEKLDRDHFMILSGEIRGAARTLKPKKKA